MKINRNTNMNIRSRWVKMLSVLTCVCVCFAMTPAIAFAGVETGSDEGVARSEIQIEKIEQNSDPAAQNPDVEVTDGNNEGENVTSPSEPVESEDADVASGDGDAPTEESVGKEADDDEALENSEEAQTARPADYYDDEDEYVDENSGELSSNDMPAITYLITVVFTGIKKASLINKDYAITFDVLIYEFFSDIAGDYTVRYDSITLNKSDAEISYDKEHNAVLSWILSGSEGDGNTESYYFLDFNSYKQHNYKIPGYKYKGSGGAGIYIDVLGDAEATENFLDENPADYTWLWGLGVVNNQYTKTSQDKTTGVDNSPVTGDGFNPTLWMLILCIAALGSVAASFGFVKRERKQSK